MHEYIAGGTQSQTLARVQIPIVAGNAWDSDDDDHTWIKIMNQ